MQLITAPRGGAVLVSETSSQIMTALVSLPVARPIQGSTAVDDGQKVPPRRRLADLIRPPELRPAKIKMSSK